MHFINPEECAIPLFPHDSGRHPVPLQNEFDVGVVCLERGQATYTDASRLSECLLGESRVAVDESIGCTQVATL